MPSWGMDDMADALPEAEAQNPAKVSTNSYTFNHPKNSANCLKAAAVDPNAPLTTKLVAENGLNPQEHGWVMKSGFDYEKYGKSSKELAHLNATQGGENGDDALAGLDPVGGLREGDWANNAAIYTWNDDFGDVGPEFPELEKMLFGGDHVKKGIAFDK